MPKLNPIDPTILSRDNTFCVERDIDYLINELQQIKCSGANKIIFYGTNETVRVFSTNKETNITHELINL